MTTDRQDKPLSGRLALITGASRGIGREIALGLGKAGAHVILVARTTGALEEVDDEIQAAGGEAATLVPLNLTDYPAIDRLGGAIAERWGHLDILIGNAGLLGGLSPVTHTDIKDWDAVMNVNVTANWRLLRSFDPLLRAARAGRAVFLTSSVARKVKPYWGAYAASKAAMEKMVEIYAAEVANITNVRANLLDPGAMRTAMREEAMPGEDPETLPQPSEIMPLVMEMISPAQDASGRLFSFRERREAER